MSSLSAVYSRVFLMHLYRWLVIAVGSAVFIAALIKQSQIGFGSNLILLAGFTALVAARIHIKLTRFNGTITVADTFIFLALLLWGIPAATFVAVAESIASTSKVARRVQTFLFNASVSIVSVYLTGLTLEYFFSVPPSKLVSGLPENFVLSVGLMGLTYYVVSLSLIAVLQALKMQGEEWRTWMRQYFLWSCITFFVAAAAAGLVVKFVGNVNFFSILILAPIIFLLYFTYQSYLKNVDALQESEARFRSSFDYATVGMALVSPEGFWLQVNESLRELLARDTNDILRQNYRDAVHAEDVGRIEENIASVLDGDIPTFQCEVRLVRPDGGIEWALLSASTARDAQNAVRHLIFQTQNITLRKKAEEKLLHDASHDVLTGLLNRAAYITQLRTALARAKRHKENALAVLFLDLDGFKMINDSLGHAVGDELLKETSTRLLECVRAIDTVARLGGDEFTILLEELNDVRRAVRVAERIKERFSEPFLLSGQEVFIGTSIGIATSEIVYREAGDMLRDADAAMYQAKARGKGCYVLFDHEMHANVTRQLRLANDLRRASERGEFILHYQAVQSLEDESIYGFEALTRWEHPVYGMLMPSEFIPLAEENGLTNEIDRWALLTSCRKMREWQQENVDFENLIISVNISTKQFTQGGLFEFVKGVLDETKLEPTCLQLEITESTMAKNIKNTARILTNLHDLGVKIALDDFGTGYSSLSYLHELPIDTLKIDRSFICRLHDETDGAAIVRAIIVLARNLRIKVIAEGIETLDQFKNLRGMGCDYGQGFLFSRPIPVSDTLKLLKASHEHQSQLANRRHTQLRLVSNQ